MNFGRLLSIVLKELRQLKRDRLTFAMIIGIPTMQLMLFGYAINLDVRHLPGAVFDEANTAESRDVIASIEATDVIDFNYRAQSAAEIDSLLQRGEISAALVIPHDFANRIALHDRPPAQIIVDGSDQVIQAAARQLAAFPIPYQPGWLDAAGRTEIVNYYNPERRAAINTVPGLIGVILTMTMVLFTSLALVRERERGNLEMLIATPVSPWELTVGKVLPFVGIGLLQVTVVLLLGRFLFQVPIRGDLPALYFSALVFIIASLTLGVFISTLAKSQFQAMQMAFFTFLPQILLSGFMFPYAGMPVPAQWIAEILPLTHFLRLVRGIMLRAADISQLWPSLAALGVFSLVMMTVAVTRVHKRLD